MATITATKCTRIDAEEWKNTKNTDGIPPLGSNIHNCECTACKAVMKDTAQWTSMQKEADSDIVIKIGDRVLVHGCLPGVVRYVGDLDSDYTNDQIYIGVKLDDPVGNNNGTLNNKRYFTCPENHGIIVPIEKVHILVPRDGRSIPVYPANRFYSMPEMSDLDSLTSGTLSRSETPREVLQRVFSDGYLSSYQATPAVSPIASKISLDDVVGLGKDLKWSSEEHMNRSAVFICKEPGSIAAGVEVPEFVKSLIKLVRDPDATAGGDDTTSVKEEAVDSERNTEKTTEENGDASENEKSITGAKLDRTKSIQGNSIIIDSVKKIEHKQNTPVEVSSKTPTKKVHSTLLSCRKLLMSNSVPNAGSQFNKVQLTTSQSASGSVNMDIKKTNVSKLATTAAAANSEDYSKKPTTKVDEEMEPKDIELENTDVSPPEVPRLNLVPEPEAQVKSDKEPSTLVPNPSYTSQLLSSLPDEEDMTPLSASTQLNEVMQFGDWVNTWGGGMKGWVMAQTLQKLKDAQRKGAKEVQWQKSIDELEMDDEYGPRIRHIKVLREEIRMVQKMQAEIEQELREKKIALSASKLCQEIETIQEETKAVQKMNKELVKKLKGSPLFANIGEALEQFDYPGLQ